MKKIILVLCVYILLFSGCVSRSDYEQAIEDSYWKGYEEGISEGYGDAYDDGFADGFLSGYDYGYWDGDEGLPYAH